MRKFIIYGKQGCTACQQAKQLIELKGFEFEYLQLGKDYTLSEFTKMTNQRTFPFIVEKLNDFPDDAVSGKKYAILQDKIGTFVDLQKLIGG